MRGGVIIVAVGLFLLYLGVSGKYCCVTQFLNCAASSSSEPCACGASAVASVESANSPTSFTELLRPLELPGFTAAPYNFNLFG